MSRVYFATKKDLTVGVNFMEELEQPIAKKFTFQDTEDENITGYAGTRLSALRAVMDFISKADTEKMTNIATLYVIPTLSDILINGTYKYWLLTGKNSKGQDVDQETLNAFKDFAKLWTEKGMYFTIKNIFDCRIADKVMESKVKYAKFSLRSRQNNEYARFCWNEVSKIYSDELDSQIAKVQ